MNKKKKYEQINNYDNQKNHNENIVYKPENQYVEVDGRQTTPLDACWYCLDCLKYTLDMVNWMYYE